MEINIEKYKEKSEQVMIRTDKEQYKQIKDLAKTKNTTMSAICRALIEAALIEMHNKS